MADIRLRVGHFAKTCPEGPILDCANIIIAYYGQLTNRMFFTIACFYHNYLAQVCRRLSDTGQCLD